MRTLEEIKKTIVIDERMRVLRLTFGQLREELPIILELVQQFSSGFQRDVDLVEIHTGSVSASNIRKLVRPISTPLAEVTESLKRIAHEGK